MIAPDTAAVQAGAGLIESVAQRLSNPMQVVDGVLSAGLDAVAEAAALLPTPVVIAAAGLLVWNGRRLVRGVVAVLALHGVVLSGLWAETVGTLLFGVLAGVLGAGLALAVFTAGRPLLRRLGSVQQPRFSAIVAIVAVTAVALTALAGHAPRPVWNLGAIVLAAGLAASGSSLQPGLPWQQRGVSVVDIGLAAALLVGMVSGTGLGGSAVRAAATGDTSLALQVLLAITGTVAALVAALPLDRWSVTAPTDSEGRAPSAGARLWEERS